LKNFIQNIVSIFLILVLHFSFLSAGTTGKISGKVKNSVTGEVLPGSTIVIEGTTLGAVGNVEGQYFIINVRPGTYSVRATMLGYEPTKMKNVVVSADLTTQIDFLLNPTTVELEEKVVTAERPLFQKDNTAKLSVITADEFINLPVNSIQEVLSTKAGFTTDAEGEIHARGGRSGEIAYLIDGQYVKDPLYGDFNNTINKDAVQELSVVSGSFNAEYGEAMSSIVNVVTKEGEESYHGKMEYTSPMINKSLYRMSNPFSGVQDLYSYSKTSIIDRISFDPLKLDIPIPGMINASLNGPIPYIDNLTFFVSGKTQNEDSYLPHGYNLERDLFSKLTYRISPVIKLSLSAQSSKNEYQKYNHAWKYLSDNQSHFEKITDRYVATLTHTVDADLFYTFQLSRFNNTHIEQVGNKLPSQYVRGQTGTDVYFYVQGDDSPYSNNVTATNSGKIDVTYQLNNFNQLKSGVEIKNHHIQVYEESEPWEGGTKYKDAYSRSPIEGAFYAQDKIEYDYLITNLGFRFDYVDPNATVWPDIRRFGYYDANNNWIPAPEQKVSAKTQLSPRIGLAHPVTDRAVLHFSYGHFFQNPDYNALYYNHNKDLSTPLPLLGNPSVKAQKTIAYESGIKYKLSDDFALEISGWYKDITDLLSTLQVSYLSQDYVVYYNSDYASVKGIDLTLNKRYSNYLSGSINYTYMVAKGNNSQPLGGFVSAYTKEEIPHRENYLDFDQTHTFVVNVSISIPHDKGLQLFDLYPFADVNLNILLQASSGLPYTPYVDPSVRVDINSARKPWTSTVDLRASKKIWSSVLSTNLFLEITNLLNVENVLYVYSRTGKPFDTGVSGFVGSSPDADHNPANLGPPRIIKAGIQFSW
jgi:outer membrane receptor for ferrienterochelin and colicin